MCLAAWPRRSESRVDTVALALGWLLHALALVFDIAGSGAGARFGFAPVLSLTVWMVILVYGIESRMLPLPAVRRALAYAGCAAVMLAWAFPGEVRLASASPWAPVHWVMGVGLVRAVCAWRCCTPVCSMPPSGGCVAKWPDRAR